MLKCWYVYILECRDKSFYTGMTTDLIRRVNQHNNKTGAKSLKGKLPVKLVYNEQFNDRIDAAKREREIKGWTRIKKIELVSGFNNEKGLPRVKRRAVSSTGRAIPS